MLARNTKTFRNLSMGNSECYRSLQICSNFFNTFCKFPLGLFLHDNPFYRETPTGNIRNIQMLYLAGHGTEAIRSI